MLPATGKRRIGSAVIMREALCMFAWNLRSTKKRAHNCAFIIASGVRLSPLGTAATIGLLYQPRMIDGDCGEIGGMKIGR
jgi:hypothetical protein